MILASREREFVYSRVTDLEHARSDKGDKSEKILVIGEL